LFFTYVSLATTLAVFTSNLFDMIETI